MEAVRVAKTRPRQGGGLEKILARMIHPPAPHDLAERPDAEPAPETCHPVVGLWVILRRTMAVFFLLWACLFAALWARSREHYEAIAFPMPKGNLIVISYDYRQCLLWDAGGYTLSTPLIPLLGISHHPMRLTPRFLAATRTQPRWGFEWRPFPLFNGPSLQCPSWFATSMTFVAALVLLGWKKLFRRH